MDVGNRINRLDGRHPHPRGSQRAQAAGRGGGLSHSALADKDFSVDSARVVVDALAVLCGGSRHGNGDFQRSARVSKGTVGLRDLVYADRSTG